MRVGQYVAVIFLLYVEVKGDGVNESVRLNEGDAKAHLKGFSKIKPGSRWTLEQNGTVVLRRCSPEEEEYGCKNFTSPRFSVQTVNDTVFIVLHNVTDSDAGSYTFQVAGDNEEQFNVTVEKPTGSTEKPTGSTEKRTGSTEKRTGSTETESPNTSSINIPLAICLSILAVLLLLLYIICKHKEKITIWLKRLREPHCDMSVQSSECEETSRDSVIIIDNKNPQNLQPLLLSDGKTSSLQGITVC